MLGKCGKINVTGFQLVDVKILNGFYVWGSILLFPACGREMEWGLGKKNAMPINALRKRDGELLFFDP